MRRAKATLHSVVQMAHTHQISKPWAGHNRDVAVLQPASHNIELAFSDTCDSPVLAHLREQSSGVPSTHAAFDQVNVIKKMCSSESLRTAPSPACYAACP